MAETRKNTNETQKNTNKKGKPEERLLAIQKKIEEFKLDDSKKMDFRVYGFIGAMVKGNSFNSDLSGMPRTYANGEILASYQSHNKLIRRYFIENLDFNSYPIFGWTSTKLVMGKDGIERLVPLTLEERYEELFGAHPKEHGAREILYNLFSCLDIRMFGLAFAVDGCSLSIHGPISIQNSTNLIKDSTIQLQGLSSPYRNSSEKGKDHKKTTLGTQFVVDKALHCFPVVVNPNSHKEYQKYIGDRACLTKKDYELFKKASLTAVTDCNSYSKKGCYNVFAIYIELKSDAGEGLPNLNNLIKYIEPEDEDKGALDLSKFGFLDAHNEKIQAIEVYYDNLTLDIVLPKEWDNNLRDKCTLMDMSGNVLNTEKEI